MAKKALKAGKHRRLAAGELRANCGLEGMKFKTTDDIKPLDSIVGQERALKAIRTGLGIGGPGYNIYVSGLVGTGRSTTIQSILEKIDHGGNIPPDYCYVHNFKEPDRPSMLALPAGMGCHLRDDMDQLVSDLRLEFPNAFEKEEYQRKRQEITAQYSKKEEEIMSGFRDQARKKGFELAKSPAPFEELMLVPVIDGKPIQDQEEMASIGEEKLKEVRQHQQEIQIRMVKVFREGSKLKKELRAELEELDQKLGYSIIIHHLDELRDKFKDEKVHAYLAEVQAHILKNLDRFRAKSEQQMVLPGVVMSKPPDSFIEYQVNIIVDNCELKGVPVVVEPAPTYANLFGTIERVIDAQGRVGTDFSHIKAGSLLRANGGYLVFNMEDALTELEVWKNLKRTLKRGQVEMQSYGPFFIAPLSGLKPEPIDVSVKVVTIGSSWLYNMLYSYDEDFKKLFKVRADFGSDFPRTKASQKSYVRFVAKICKGEDLRPFDRTAVEAVIEYGVRAAEDKKKLSTRFSDVADLVREASFWAGEVRSRVVKRRHVERARAEKLGRINLVEEKIQELIEDGKIMIDVRGSVVGQVNGLSIYDLGEFSFGRPSRITARTSMGRSGIINIEREADLGGRTHNKGMLILGGYIRGRYAQDKPLALSASICFEQSYAGVEGDSASSTELYALLSSLSGLPIQQGIAVTGSVNQKGEIQPIGGVNQKIEGFFAVCKAAGLTGRQGVMIPASNVGDLMLEDEVISAVRKGRFHIYPVKTVDEGIEILTGVRAGGIRVKGTVNSLVNQRLAELARGFKEYDGGAHEAAPAPGNRGRGRMKKRNR